MEPLNKSIIFSSLLLLSQGSHSTGNHLQNCIIAKRSDSSSNKPQSCRNPFPQLQIDYHFDPNKIVLDARNGELDSIAFFLEKDPNLLKKSNDHGKNVMTEAASFGQLDIIKHIAENNPELLLESNQGGEHAIVLATLHGDLKIIKYIDQNHNSLLFEPSANGWTVPTILELKDESKPDYAQHKQVDIIEYFKEQTPESLKKLEKTLEVLKNVIFDCLFWYTFYRFATLNK